MEIINMGNREKKAQTATAAAGKNIRTEVQANSE